MNKQQVIKIIDVMFVAVLFMTAFEVLFAFPQVSNSIQTWIEGMENKTMIWIAFWLVMFIQVCIIPIPAYIVLNAAVNIHIIDSTLGLKVFATQDLWILILVIISAYMAGASVAYLAGAKLGKKAVLWCAGTEEEYDKWSDVFNRGGKWAYAATVLFPLFPDDLLCLVAGSVRIHFGFFFVSNLICRSIGTITMIGALVVFNNFNKGGIPWTLIFWVTVLIGLIVAYHVLKHLIKKENDLKASE